MSIISKDSVVIKQVKNFEKLNANAILADNIDKYKKVIVDRQKEQLLFGEGEDGKKIKPKYKSDKYAQRKNQQNSLAGKGNPDLFASGDMFRELDLLVGVPNDNSYSFYSDVSYFNDLQDKYKTAFGLNAKSMKMIPQVNNGTLKDIHIAINK
jgi:hypothetical protein